MSIYLVVIFMMSGEPTVVSGYEPRVQADLQVCAARIDYMERYLNIIPDMPEVGIVGCTVADSPEAAARQMIPRLGMKI